MSGDPVRATWARLRTGAWGLRCEGAVATGDVVRAERRSGASALVRVGRVAWTGDGITLAEAGEEVREPRAEAAPRRRAGSRRAAPVEAPAPVPAATAALFDALRAAGEARAAGRREAGDLGAHAHLMLDRAITAWAADPPAPVQAPAPVQVPAPVAEAPVQAAEPARAAGCKPWRRCMSGGCAACAPDAPAPADGVPF